VSQNPVFIDDSFSYFSLLNITGKAEGINIENAKYNLDNGVINCDYQYGVSNEVLKGKTAKVTVEKGDLLLVKVF
jgi:thiamine pyrophosphokinase